jgi:hypothetical protein
VRESLSSNSDFAVLIAVVGVARSNRFDDFGEEGVDLLR